MMVLKIREIHRTDHESSIYGIIEKKNNLKDHVNILIKFYHLIRPGYVFVPNTNIT